MIGAIYRGVYYAPEEVQEFSAEVLEKVSIYQIALTALASKNEQRFNPYRKNWDLWKNWNIPQRLWWINNIEQQARDGHQTIGAILVAKVVELRLES